jgi:hypothetical protein
MNGSSHLTDEHHIVSEYLQGLPASKHRYGTAGLVRFLGKQEIEAAAKAPAGAAALIVMGAWGSQPPSIIPEGLFSWEIILFKL